MGGRPKARCESPEPMSAVSSSWTIFTTCCPGVRLFRTSWPSARSFTEAVKSRATSRLTSASRRARRISRIAFEIASSSRRPLRPSPPRVDWSLSDRVSNTARQCTAALTLVRVDSRPKQRPDLPAGTVTLLFADVEGSTRLLHLLGERFAPARTRMRELVRAAAADNGGAEVDWAGDGVFLAFARATDAISAAAEIQRSLAAEPWPDEEAHRLRVGIHTGEPDLGDDGYVGMDVVVAARICASAHGEQVVVSRVTRDMAGEEPLPGASFRPLGRHRLKDVPSASELFQLRAPDLREDFPPLKTLSATSLPALHHRLVGRADALVRVETLLATCGRSTRHDHRARAAQGRAVSRSRWPRARPSSAPCISSGSRRSRTPTSCPARSPAPIGVRESSGAARSRGGRRQPERSGRAALPRQPRAPRSRRHPRRRASRSRARPPGARDEPRAASPLDRARPPARSRSRSTTRRRSSSSSLPPAA